MADLRFRSEAEKRRSGRNPLHLRKLYMPHATARRFRLTLTILLTPGSCMVTP